MSNLCPYSKTAKIKSACGYGLTITKKNWRKFIGLYGLRVLAFTSVVDFLPPDVIGTIFSNFVYDVGKPETERILGCRRVSSADRYTVLRQTKFDKLGPRKDEKLRAIAEFQDENYKMLELMMMGREDKRCSEPQSNIYISDNVYTRDVRICRLQSEICTVNVKKLNMEINLNVSKCRVAKGDVRERKKIIAEHFTLLHKLEKDRATARRDLERIINQPHLTSKHITIQVWCRR